MASIAAPREQARPKLVCRIVPVALTTRIWPGRLSMKIATLDPFENRIFVQIRLRVAALPDFSANLIEHGAALFGDIFPIVARQQRLAAGMLEQAIDGRKFAQQIRGLIGHEETKICTGKRQIQHRSIEFKLRDQLTTFPSLTSARQLP